jgi:hypothetical protein
LDLSKIDSCCKYCVELYIPQWEMIREVGELHTHISATLLLMDIISQND